VWAAITGKVTVLTGGPGTGKTQAVRAIVRALEWTKGWFDAPYALCAPTGRAAKRLSETTGRPAQTVHRLLGYNPEKGFLHTASHPLSLSYLIVDEASMLDLSLTHHLLQALEPSTQVLFVGDVDQLPSVGAGNVLRDLIASGVIPVVCLAYIFRQAAGSGIVVNAHRINRGEAPILDEYDDFYFFGRSAPDEAANMVVDVVQRRIPNKFGLRSIDDLQVLSPMYRGSCGVDVLNERLQEALNPAGRHKAEQKLGGRVFRVGDKVMQTCNDYAKDVFNGDVGRVVAVNSQRKELLVKVDERVVPYTWGETGDLEHAFAMSIHKSQGSEYPAVVVPVTTQHYLMLQRNLLYTAVTRARSLAVLVGTRQAVSIAVSNDRVCKRYSGLRTRL
jgi:exodeoxyribonuclease V alpha subunit